MKAEQDDHLKCFVEAVLAKRPKHAGHLKMNEQSVGQRRATSRVATMVAKAYFAQKEGFKSLDEMALSAAAFESHPGWQRADAGTVIIAGDLVLRKIGEKSWEEVGSTALIVNGHSFLKVNKRAPNTITGVVKWFERTHPEQVERIRKKIAGKEPG
jgi:hypothetical protein